MLVGRIHLRGGCRSILSLGGLLLCVGLLFGCSTGNRGKSIRSEQLEHQNLSKIVQLESIVARGSCRIVSRDQNGHRVRFWFKKEKGDRFSLRIFTSMGATLVFIEQTPLGLRYVNSQKQQVLFEPMSELRVPELNGMVLPLARLMNWSLGIPNSTDRDLLWDGYGRLQGAYGGTGLQWKLTVTDYLPFREFFLPKLLSIDELSGQNVFFIQFDHWSFS